jgi:hypothetical protein
MTDYNQIIFCNDVWEALKDEKDDVLREFVNTMIEVNKNYHISGGAYPTIDYVIGLVKDKIKETVVDDLGTEDKCAVTEDKCAVTEDKCAVTEDKCAVTEDKCAAVPVTTETDQQRSDRIRQARIKFYSK